MRFVSFNVNGIRARMHQLEAVRDKLQPHVIAVQEIKVVDEQFPLDDIHAIGYPHVSFYGQKGHYGVALLSTEPLLDVQCGIPWRESDQQRRFISASIELAGQRIKLINGYYPQGDAREHATKFPNKAEFYRDITTYLNKHCDPDEHLIVAGDMNVAPQDVDIGIGEKNAKRWLRTGKCSFLPEEREWLSKVSSFGLIDSYAECTSDEQRLYSWFDYRSRGFEQDPKRGLRIDLILATSSLMAKVEACGIDYEIRSQEKPSDHCPVWSNFSL